MYCPPVRTDLPKEETGERESWLLGELAVELREFSTSAAVKLSGAALLRLDSHEVPESLLLLRFNLFILFAAAGIGFVKNGDSIIFGGGGMTSSAVGFLASLIMSFVAYVSGYVKTKGSCLSILGDALAGRIIGSKDAYLDSLPYAGVDSAVVDIEARLSEGLSSFSSSPVK